MNATVPGVINIKVKLPNESIKSIEKRFFSTRKSLDKVLVYFDHTHSALVSGGRGQYCVVYVGALLWNVSKSEFTDRDR